MKKVLLLLFMLTIGLALTACSQSNDASAEQKEEKKASEKKEETTKDKTENKTDEEVHKIGETFKAMNTNFSVNKIYTAQKGEYKVKLSEEKERSLQKNEEFLIAEVTIENKGEKSIDYSILGFELKDGKDKTILPNIVSTPDIDTYIQAGNLASDKKVTGTISFVVPKGEKDLTLVYKPSFFDLTKKENIHYLITLR
ncbi:DUF4352 domain-containing protein [Bacillus atrophaeus]|uniref:DUF4352 domain-containing protein n=1 Tax=Bacillus atrophaeus TaxID=1452 RepID=UPI00227E1B69|nr:DUF4352 domain-containing protein [Bacillus atrophaeus]MCY8823700.1 DUF4352 domain-containing protein [Bacillus atrophaeus]MCY8841208.1 DUF4352 domain-containing protein [Bacillus atrophaeus]MCY8916803.1 DUF4352 domain-containing protein [Bacillus atrophaeus]MCY8925570.1 DUF4352 domain-containing protein [Bacillus atrophaeus]MCY8959049.1 DUF4352 domain-containing protein [Bacillus atrophaeus]